MKYQLAAIFISELILVLLKMLYKVWFDTYYKHYFNDNDDTVGITV